MAKFTVYGTMPVNFYVTVEAESEDAAMEFVEDNLTDVEYCNETVGVDMYEWDGVENVELTTNSWFDFEGVEKAND